MPISLEVWGDYALFCRLELKTERTSYDVMTPSAARGLIEAIYWHPGLRWVIDRIRVCAPIRFSNLRRNEVKSTISANAAHTAMKRGAADLYLCTSDDIQQRAALLLRDVRYVIEAHFDFLPDRAAPGDSEGKFQDIVKRRIRKGQFYHQPCFGCREFPRPLQVVRRAAALPGGVARHARSGLDALRHGLFGPAGYQAPCSSAASWRTACCMSRRATAGRCGG